MLKLDFAFKFVATEKDILLNAMTEIMLMVMDAAKIVKPKLDLPAMVDLQIQKTSVVLQFQLSFQLKTEGNQDFTEK